MPEELNPSTIWIVLCGIIGGLLVFKIIVDAITKWRELRKPQADAAEALDARLRSIERKLASDKERLDGIDRRMNAISIGQRDIRSGFAVMCRALSALLQHELHNGNSDQMQAARNELTDYLTNRPTATEGE